MTAMARTPEHPVARAVARIHTELDELTEVGLWSIGPGEAAQTLREATRLRARAAELELRVAAHAESVQVGEASGAVSTGAWWAHQTRQDRHATTRSMHLAAALAGPRDRVRVALATGQVSLEQAEVIVHALQVLPADLDPELICQAEAELVARAGEYDPKTLRILGRRILEVVAPEIGEAHENKILEREEAQAAAATRFTMTDDGHGKTYGRFTLPTARAAMLRKALLALAAPKHQTAVEGTLPPRRPGPERMGRAFLEYVERYPTKRLPKSGGLNATVVVTMTLETLTGGLKAAQLDTGESICAGQARRLACEAGIIPIVLGGESVVLDVGRKRRFHSEPQRVAVGVRDKKCTGEGCDWPPGLCQTHHEIPWHLGGGTSVKLGRLLCPRHHARAHDPAFTMTKLPGGKVAFARRT